MICGGTHLNTCTLEYLGPEVVVEEERGVGFAAPTGAFANNPFVGAGFGAVGGAGDTPAVGEAGATPFVGFGFGADFGGVGV